MVRSYSTLHYCKNINFKETVVRRFFDIFYMEWGFATHTSDVIASQAGRSNSFP